MENQQLLEQLNATLQTMAAGGAAPAGGPAITFGPAPATAPMGSGWAAPPVAPMMPAGSMMPAPGGAAQAGAVLVPVSLQTPDGNDCTVYLQFGGEWAQSPMALANLLQQLMYSGVPLKTWKPKRQDWGGGNGGGGWNGGGGGYRGRGGYGGGGGYGRGGRY